MFMNFAAQTEKTKAAIISQTKALRGQGCSLSGFNYNLKEVKRVLDIALVVCCFMTL